MRASRTLAFPVFVALLALLSAACTGGGDDDDGDSAHLALPVPKALPPAFVPTDCQLVWTTYDPPGQTAVYDYYVVDAPLVSWESGDETYFQGDTTGATNVTGAWIDDYNATTHQWAQAAVATSGTFQLVVASSDPFAIGASIAFSDAVDQEYFLLDSAGGLSTPAGSGGIGGFTGVWSSPYSTNVLAGSGSVTTALLGSSQTLGTDVAFGLCYDDAAAFAPESLAARLRRAGDAVRAQ